MPKTALSGEPTLKLSYKETSKLQHINISMAIHFIQLTAKNLQNPSLLLLFFPIPENRERK